MSGDRAPLYSGSIAKADSSRPAVSARAAPVEIDSVSISVLPVPARLQARAPCVRTTILGIEH